MEFTPIETQEDFDKRISERIERAKTQARAEFSDYGELKEKASMLAVEKEQVESKLTQAQNELAELKASTEKELDALKLSNKKHEYAARFGIPADLLHGANAEELEKCARSLVNFAKANTHQNIAGVGVFATQTNATPKDEFAQFMKNLP